MSHNGSIVCKWKTSPANNVVGSPDVDKSQLQKSNFPLTSLQPFLELPLEVGFNFVGHT